jgi:uncharacterized protein
VTLPSPFRFECHRCGSCCCGHESGIPIYIADAQRLAAHLHLKIEDFLLEYCHLSLVVEEGISIPVLLLKFKHAKCPFLQKDTCLVHQYKPYLCQAAPIISMLFENQAVMHELIEKCNGYGKGKMISTSEIQLILQQEADMELADKKAYQSGWFNRLLEILPMEVSNGSETRKPALEN